MRLRGLAVIVAAAGACAACSAILGIGDVGYASPDGSIPDGGDAGDGAAESDLCPTFPTVPTCNDGGLAKCDPSGACDIDLSNDKNNCGGCGRVCDQQCNGGECDPLRLDGMPGPARVLAADDNWAFTAVGPSDQLFAIPVAGGGFAAAPPVSGQVGTIPAFVADPMVGFMLSAGGVDQTMLDGGGANTTPLAQNYQVNLNGRLVADDTHLVFTEGRTEGVVARLQKDGGGVTELASGQNQPSFVVSYGDLVVFVDQSQVDTSEGAILYVDVKQPGTAHTKITGLTQAGGLVRWGSWGYYTLRKGEIWRFNFTDWTPILVVGGLGEADTLAVDAQYLYFSGNPAGKGHGIWRVPRCGGDVTSVTTAPAGHITSTAIHGKYVYWVGQDKNELFQTTR